jgi:chemotaxis protein MotB
MAREKKQTLPDEEPGAPEWMVTFSDCMTLLLTFFVLLLSFSSFDNRVFRSLKVVYSRALTSITPIRRSDRDALSSLPPVKMLIELDNGSEKPTSSQELQEGLLKETKMMDFTNGVAFLISSKKIFWAQGPALSQEGREVLDLLTGYLRESPCRIVISENGPGNNNTGGYFGLPRAWAVLEYLTNVQNLDKDRFSISAEGIFNKKSLDNNNQDQESLETERTVEIVLLQRSVYN